MIDDWDEAAANEAAVYVALPQFFERGVCCRVLKLRV